MKGIGLSVWVFPFPLGLRQNCPEQLIWLSQLVLVLRTMNPVQSSETFCDEFSVFHPRTLGLRYGG